MIHSVQVAKERRPGGIMELQEMKVEYARRYCSLYSYRYTHPLLT